jgi:uncharacterized protein (DUF1330 family)
MQMQMRLREKENVMKLKLILAFVLGVAIGVVSAELARASARPPGLLIVEYEITDPVAWKDYLAGSRSISVERKFLARHAEGISLSGAPPKWIGIVEYPSVDDALAYDSSPEYVALKPIRDKATNWRSYVVELLPTPK